MLDSIPPEVLQKIAYHYILAAPILASPLPLLVLNRRIYDSLNPYSNPNVYAKVFRARFDTSAAERRDWGIHLPEDGEEEDDEEEDEGEHGVRRLAARRLRDELINRVGALARMRTMVEKEDVSALGEEDLWMVYIMLIENDGKNIKHLYGPDAIHLDDLLRLCREHHLLEFKTLQRMVQIRPAEDFYPHETTPRALLVWIMWLTSGYLHSMGSRSDSKLHSLLAYALRPYVFAAHKYETCYGPWTIPILPSPSSPVSSQDVNHNPFAARFLQGSRGTTIQWYGRKVTLSPPMLSHAAIMMFFSKNFEAFRVVPHPNPHAQSTVLPSLTPGVETSRLRPDEMVQLLHFVARQRADAQDWTDDPDSSIPPTAVPRNLLSHSARHDLDFDRLRLCYDSTSCPGLARRKLRHTFGGAWEGTFSFFDFDAYALMLSGQSRALYEGPYGEQAQVWKMTETWVRPVQSRTAPPAPPSPPAAAAPEPGPATLTPSSPEEPLSPTLDEEDEEISRRIVKKKKSKGKAKEPSGLPVHGPMMNAGLPTDLPSTTRQGLASAAAEAATLESTIQQQVDALPGYERVPDDEVDELLADPKTQDEMDMLLTGTGHSAWGRFILKGRVRAWDGLAILVKEYAPDSRGKWFYRGYITSTDTLVGRWRDTYTAESLVGYEGTFILSRR